MYKACIFDLDGTIADTVESMAYVGNQVLEEFGLSALPVENYNFYAGDGADELVRRMLADTPVSYTHLFVLFVITAVFSWLSFRVSGSEE